MSRELKGWLFQPKNGKGQVSPYWTIQFYKYDPDQGKTVRVREATGLTSRVKAERKLHERLKQVENKENFTVKHARVNELFVALRSEVDAHNKRPNALGVLDSRWNLHLKPVFGAMLAPSVTTKHINEYKTQRQEEGAKNATINRELQQLRRMFNFGKQCTPPLVHEVPHIKLLDESNNVRQGFIGDEDYRRLESMAREHALKPENEGEQWLRVLLELGFAYGMRKGELLGLRVKHVNFLDETIRLESAMVKNREARVLMMTPTVRELLKIAVHGKRANDHVLTWANGDPVRDFRDTWANLCIGAGLGKYVCSQCSAPWVARKKCKCGCGLRKYDGLFVHDLRRSAAKALRDAGVAEGVIMKITGHRTASMFRRYAIVDPQNLRDALNKREQVRQQATEQATGKQTGQPPADGPISSSSDGSLKVQ